MKIQTRPLDTVERIVEHILSSWSKSDLKFIAERRDVLGMVGRAIRNEFGLWNPTHPLTARWHSFPDDRDVRDGVDYSLDHPDAVSERILNEVRERLA